MLKKSRLENDMGNFLNSTFINPQEESLVYFRLCAAASQPRSCMSIRVVIDGSRNGRLL